MDHQKASEALSVLNTLLEEISNRKKKQSDMVMDDSELPHNDSFIDSPSFLELIKRIIQRSQVILSTEKVISKKT